MNLVKKCHLMNHEFGKKYYLRNNKFHKKCNSTNHIFASLQNHDFVNYHSTITGMRNGL